jgi:hypothetical protein
LLLGPGGDNPPGSHWPNAVHFPEAIGLGFDDIEDLLGKDPHELAGIDRADPPDHPRRQVLFDAFGR